MISHINGFNIYQQNITPTNQRIYTKQSSTTICGIFSKIHHILKQTKNVLKNSERNEITSVS